jgi:hypothetical protein
MKLIKKTSRIFTTLLFGLLLNGCDGGGGGGDSSPSLSVSQSSITFAARLNESKPAPLTVSASISNLNSSVYIGVFFTQNALSSVTYDLSANPIPITINPQAPGALGPGTYTDEVTIVACSDQNCDTHIAGSPYAVHVTYTVGGISVSPNALSFTAHEGTLPANQTLSLSNIDTNNTWSASIAYQGNTAGWLTVSPTSSSDSLSTVSVGVGALPSGTYGASIVFSAGTESLTVPVTYTVNSSITVSPSALSFTAKEGNLPANQTLSLSNLNTSNAWSASIAYQGNTTDWLAISPTSSSDSLSTVSVRADALPSGTYGASIVFSAGTGSLTVPVTYTVGSSIIASPSELSFNAVEGSVPAGKSIEISGLDTSWSASVRYSNESSWLSISPASGVSMPATLSVNPTALSAGTYSAQVVITYDVGSNTGEWIIPVTYVVDPIRLEGPANANFSINLGSNASDTRQTINISTNKEQGLDWNASSSASWLTLSPGSGNTSNQNQITLALDLEELQTLGSGTYNSTVTISTTYTGVPDVNIAVRLTLDKASIDYVTPYVLYENQPRQVTLKGSGLMQAAGLSMEIGSTTTSSFSIVDDNEISIEIPALPAGEYSFRLLDTLGIASTSGRLLVKTAPTYQETVIPIHGRPESIEYDPERDAFFAVLWNLDYGSDYVAQRIRFDGVKWTVVDLSVQKPLAVGLTVDGSELLVTTANCEVVHVNPDTLAITSTNRYPDSCRYERFGMVNSFDDGQILIADTEQWSSAWEYPSFENFSAPIIHTPISIRTRNRNAMLWAESPTTTGPRSIYYYSSKTDSFTQFAVQDSETYFLAYNLAISDDGKRVIHKADVYDENQNYIGSLDGVTYNGLDRIGVSPDGSHAVRFSYATKNLSIFDLSNNAGPFPQLGSDLTLPSGTFDSAFNVEFSHDGSAAFVFGLKTITSYTNEYKISVTPLP